MRRNLRIWSGLVVLACPLTGWGCGGGGPEPGMLKDAPKESPLHAGLEHMKEMRKDPKKMRDLMGQMKKDPRKLQDVMHDKKAP